MAKTKQVDAWRNRIVGYDVAAVDSILANKQNWRIHPLPQMDALLGSVESVGIVANIMINKRTSEAWPEGERNVETLVDGHLRVALAMRQGQATLPVTYVDLTPKEEALVLATLDPIGALATTDTEKFDELLREVDTDSPALQEMLSQVASKASMYGGSNQSPEELWKGMPEFEQQNAMGEYQQIIVHFVSEEDVKTFAELVNQTITHGTKWIWYPKQEREDLKAYSVQDEP